MADTREFVATCSVCARSETSHHTPARLLCPLPIPNCPWSQITVDFVTSLPPSKGNTTILTIIDRLSKAVHFMPLAKLPYALENAHLLVIHVFQLHNILQDTVSDRGPKFTLQVWKASCQALGASVSQWLPVALAPGPPRKRGWSMPTTLSSVPPQVCHLSR